MISERNRQLVSCYLENHTLQEVGDKFGITRERVRQILNEEGIAPRSWTYLRIPSPPKKTQTFSERFWSNVQIGDCDECWAYTGSVYPNGYGRFASMGKQFYAHRLAFMLHNRQSPKKWILHTCDNPPCCNPAHLYDGTPKDNTRDMMERGRHPLSYDRKGFLAFLQERRLAMAEERGYLPSRNLKLNPVAVADIKLALSKGYRSCDIAPIFAVNVRTIGAIKEGRNWKHIEAAENFSLESPLLVLTSSTNCG